MGKFCSVVTNQSPWRGRELYSHTRGTRRQHPQELPSVIREGGRGASGPERPGAQTNSREPAAGGVSLPTPPGAGHFLYGRWADAGFAPALRTIVTNPHRALGGRAGSGGRTPRPSLPAPAAGSAARGSRPGRDAAAADAAPPSAKAAASARADERKRNPRASPCCRAGGRPLRGLNASWAQHRRSLDLDSRRREGPLPPWPRGADATSFSPSRSPLLPPGGRRCLAHSHAHREEPRPRRPQSCRRAHGPRLPAPRERTAGGGGGGRTGPAGPGEEGQGSREGRRRGPCPSPSPRLVRKRRLVREDGCLSRPPAAPPHAPSPGGRRRRPPRLAGLGLGSSRRVGQTAASAAGKPLPHPGPPGFEAGGSGGAFSRIHRRNRELELSTTGGDVTPRRCTPVGKPEAH
ncbi:translation initiation factor IF-2-like [Panthera pardus]|uniref:Translation initiation factor IF-2-like n=1 Tax=Panthera pardus TaxID=9691 RepID=A0A9W2UY65_PANPR|nr:translation initiation factor IF-2-like [Panthera pardus]